MRTSWVPPRSDLILAAVLGLAAIVEVTTSSKIEPKSGAYAAELLIASGVAFRRSAPLAAATIVALGIAIESAVGVPLQEPVLPLVAYVVVAYSLASYAPLKTAIGGAFVLLGGLALQVSIASGSFGNVVFGMIFVVAFTAMGITVRRRTAEAAAGARRQANHEHELEDASRTARQDERGRIARDIHDVIAHSLSVMIVQAGAAEQVVRNDPERAVEPLQIVQETGRAALGEMSVLLNVLRSGSDMAGLAPQPGIDSLPTLLDEARGSGLPVEFATSGDQRAIPAGVGLTVYRVVQEALTNARKHAGPQTSVRVELGYSPEAVAVSVIDSGGQPTVDHNGGHGLVGMRERVESYAGTLYTGPEASGGYGVHASIPARVTT
jgi:signal transduction histidine kinase